MKQDEAFEILMNSAANLCEERYSGKTFDFIFMDTFRPMARIHEGDVEFIVSETMFRYILSNVLSRHETKVQSLKAEIESLKKDVAKLTNLLN